MEYYICLNRDIFTKKKTFFWLVQNFIKIKNKNDRHLLFTHILVTP